MITRCAAALLTLLVSAAAARAGTVSGTVVLVKDGKERTDASNTVVWIEGVHTNAPPPHAVIKSSSKRFVPRVVAIPKNATVTFPNDDPIYHNVFSVSGPNRFDLGLYRSGASKSKTFGETGLVRVYCNIHPQMVGFVVVVDSDLFAVTGADGAFRIEGVPNGPHIVKAWHEESAEVSQAVTVRTGGDAPVPIRIDVSGFQTEPHKNKYGKDYQPKAGEADDERY